MNPFRKLAVSALAAVLAITLGITAAQAADMARVLPVNNAAQLSGILPSAYFTSTQLMRQLDTEKGAFSKLFQRGLASLEHDVTRAEDFAGGHEALAPGIRHVAETTKKIIGMGKKGPEIATLLDEISIELYALTINANILEAIAHLDQAKQALAKGKDAEESAHLQAAAQALEHANNRGAYHIQNDLNEIEAALMTLADQTGTNAKKRKEAIDERIAEIGEHLFDVGQEHQ